jgi:hypothetical protein
MIFPHRRIDYDCLYFIMIFADTLIWHFFNIVSLMLDNADLLTMPLRWVLPLDVTNKTRPQAAVKCSTAQRPEKQQYAIISNAKRNTLSI